MSNLEAQLKSLEKGLASLQSSFKIAGDMRNDVLKKATPEKRIKLLDFETKYAYLMSIRDYGSAAVLKEKFEQENK